MADEPDAKATPTASSLGTAADRLRTALNWLIASLGAVAAAVLTGISLSTLGTIDPAAQALQFWLALAGAALAALGALGALATAASTVAASTVSAGDLAVTPRPRSWQSRLMDELADGPQLPHLQGASGAAAVVGFMTAYATAAKEYDDLRDRQLSSPAADDSAPPPKPTDDTVKNAVARLNWLIPRYQVLMADASYLRLRSAFRIAIRWICVFVGLSAVGILLFSYATASAANSKGPTVLTPAAWSVPDELRTIIDDQLGARCAYPLDNVPVLIVGEAEYDASTVITVPTSDCTSIEIATDTSRLVEEPSS